MAGRILVVEDDRLLLRLASSALERRGYEVEEAINGALALDKLRSNNYDLVISDVWMPGINGIELLAESRTLTQPPKFIVITADHTSETLLKVIREQAYRYLMKPFRIEHLLETVQEALECCHPVHPIEVISAKPDWVELLVPCHLPTIERIHEFIKTMEIDLPDETRDSVAIAFRELLLNAAEWGGKFDSDLNIRVSCLRTGRMILYRVKDPGMGFSLKELHHAAISNPDNSPFEHMKFREEKGLRPGGFGIMTVRALSDELIYNEQHNEVVYIKYLDEKS
ncbi:MAG: response regulator [Acidobacteriota bacterium]|nr:MAG: response regulator [Acidobacteriota bacterium]